MQHFVVPRHWLTRDHRGLSPTSDIDGCFETGPGRFFPGRFHRLVAFQCFAVKKQPIDRDGEKTLSLSLSRSESISMLLYIVNKSLPVFRCM